MANACLPSFDVATAFTVNVPDFLKAWLILFQLLTIPFVPSQKSHSIFVKFQFVKGSNLTTVGNHVLIASTLIKKLKPKLLLPKGVWSRSFFRKDAIMWLLSSTIHTGFFFQSQSISSSHTFQIPSLSSSYWFWLNTYGQLSSQFVIQSQS